VRSRDVTFEIGKTARENEDPDLLSTANPKQPIVPNSGSSAVIDLRIPTQTRTSHRERLKTHSIRQIGYKQSLGHPKLIDRYKQLNPRKNPTLFPWYQLQEQELNNPFQNVYHPVTRKEFLRRR
jgi:hypothetical protein